MSKPAASNDGPPGINPQVGLMFSAAGHLVPLFKTGTVEAPLARKMAMSAVAAYNPETRADYVNVARTIAFSMAALALLGRAVTEELTFPEQMRAYGRANALNRSADQSERTMMQRRRYEKANPPAEMPGWMDPGSEHSVPEAPIDEADVHAAVAETMREYRAHAEAVRAQSAHPPSGHPETAGPDTAPQPVSVAPKSAAPPASAIRYADARTDTGQSRMTYREKPLRDSAMQRVVGDDVVRQGASA